MIVLVMGTTGSGKTTLAAKLALWLRDQGNTPLLVAADLQRPAAVEQLFTLGGEIGVPVVSDGRDPVKVAKSAVKQASRSSPIAVFIALCCSGRLSVMVAIRLSTP